uniref:Uncharacterized protein n=1 Tax=Anguilla anguilla TaxID=7936 RepID=A0A0E9VYB6_ANGAN
MLVWHILFCYLCQCSCLQN